MDKTRTVKPITLDTENGVVNDNAVDRTHSAGHHNGCAITNDARDITRDNTQSVAITDAQMNTDPDTSTDVLASREEAQAAFIRDRRIRTEQLLARASTEIYAEMQHQIAAYQEPLTDAAEDQYRMVAQSFCDLDGAMNAAIRLAGQIEAHKGKIDTDVERGMRQALDTLLMAIAALPPQNQLTLIAKVQLLGQLGPSFDQNINLRAMLMAAMEHDAIRLSRIDPVFENIPTESVH